MNKFIPIFLGVLLLLCSNRQADYLIRYQRFLGHSLGDYQVIIDGEIRTFGEPAPEWKTYKLWELQFTRQNGEARTFRFVDGEFPRQVLAHAIDIAREEIKSEVASQYFDEGLIDIHRMPIHSANVIIPGRETVVLIPGYVDFGYSFAPVANPRNGLRLYSVTPQELVADWGVRFGVSVYTRDYENYADILERFKALTRTLADYLEQDETQVFFTLRGNGEDTDEIRFRGVYHRQTDTFAVQ
ncbi:MAG: hypothetical protein FWC72_01755 [Oscillospiraceae bacterium]|nr:hypothetical protein [Oscillospiraceae bacterium]